MRAVLLLLALSAMSCGTYESGGGCERDSECGGDVCARNGECLPDSSVRSVRITWTIRGQMANATTCAPSPSLYLLFSGFEPGDTFGYEPVPCDAGLFFIDKLPSRFGAVEIGERDSFQMEKAFDASGNVSFDLMP